MRLTFYGLTILLVLTTTVDYRLLAGVPGVPSVTLAEAVAYLMLALYLGRYGFRGGTTPFRASHRGATDVAVLGYFAWAGFAALVGLTRSADTLQVYKSMFPSVLVYLFVTSYIDREARVRAVLVAYGFGLALNGFIGILQVHTGSFYLGGFHEITFFKTDASGQQAGQLALGLFPHPNGYATFLIPCAVTALCMLTRGRRHLGKGYFPLLALTGVVLYNLYYTHGKGAYLWTLVGLTLVFLPSKLRSWRVSLGVVTLVATSSTLVLLSTITYLRGITSLGTVVTRIKLWISALDAIAGDPFIQMFGSGYSQMLDSSHIYSHMPYGNSHNAILNQILNYGIPGLLLYLCVFLTALRQKTPANGARVGFLGAVDAGVYASLIALFGDYVFEPADQSVVLQAHFFFFVAMAAVVGRLSARTRKMVSEGTTSLEGPCQAPLAATCASSCEVPPAHHFTGEPASAKS